jgi:hypothetical protein
VCLYEKCVAYVIQRAKGSFGLSILGGCVGQERRK